MTWLAYYEQTADVGSAIEREKQIKGWRRSKKVSLIESRNPRWRDLSLEWHDENSSAALRALGMTHDEEWRTDALGSGHDERKCVRFMTMAKDLYVGARSA